MPNKSAQVLAGLSIILISSFISNNLLAQIETGQLLSGELNAIQTSVPFLIIAPDSRAGAMGDVGVATKADVNSQHWNVAKYPFIEGDGGIAISYTPWLRSLINDINLAYLSGYYRIDDQQVLSGSLRYFALGNIKFTDIEGNSQGEYNPNEFALDAGYSRLFSDHLSGGIAFRFVRSDLTSGQEINGTESRPGISFAADLGVYYENDLDIGGSDGKYALGASITNMGTPISYTAEATKVPIPTNLRLGGRFDYDLDQYNTISATIDFNKLLVPTPPVWAIDTATNEQYVEYGMEPPSSVLVGMIHSFYDAPGIPRTDGTRNVFVEELYEIAIGTGVEYWYRDQFGIRAGYFHENAVKGNRKYFTVGVGLKLNVFNIDFSYLVPTNGIQSPLANTLRFTLGFDFDNFNLQ